MRVKIDAGGREVEIECADANVTAKDISEQALAIWEQTSGAKGGEGPAYGFSAQVQPHTTRDPYAWRMGDGEQIPVRAEAP